MDVLNHFLMLVLLAALAVAFIVIARRLCD